MKFSSRRDKESTAFRHIDFSIERAIQMGRGMNAIQGTVSLVDEKEPNCTVIVKGMHKKFHEWHELIKDREGYSKEAFISRIDNAYLSGEDIKWLSLRG